VFRHLVIKNHSWSTEWSILIYWFICTFYHLNLAIPPWLKCSAILIRAKSMRYCIRNNRPSDMNGLVILMVVHSFGFLSGHHHRSQYWLMDFARKFKYHIQEQHIHLIFDRYKDFSTKYSTRIQNGRRLCKDLLYHQLAFYHTEQSYNIHMGFYRYTYKGNLWCNCL